MDDRAHESGALVRREDRDRASDKTHNNRVLMSSLLPFEAPG
jgi:hypothetical protein